MDTEFVSRAEKGIRELEDGITTRYQTKIIEDPNEIVKEGYPRSFQIS